MKVIKKLKDEQLLFDFEFNCPTIDSRYYREGAQDLIRRLVPDSLLSERSSSLSLDQVRFADMLPMLSWSDLSKAPCTLSVLLLCKYRLNGCGFFYEMISRWLLPQKKVHVELYFTSDVRIPHLTDDLLSVAEIVIQLKSVQEVEEVRRNLQSIETEIRLGVVSNYQARRILDFKGLSSDGKTAMIQEKISSLIQSHSKDFDKGIFSQMQQFLVTVSSEFKRARDYHHISRIISNLYSLRKFLKQNIEGLPLKRHVQVKLLKTQLGKEKAAVDQVFEDDFFSFNEKSLHGTVSVSNIQSSIAKPRHVLGILVGLNFLKEHEIFETSHLFAAVQKHLTLVKPVESSFFVDRSSDSSLQTLYMEIEKPDGSDFNLEEIQILRTSLPDQIKGHVELLAHPIFMPRNEEEVLRNIMALSRQLRFVNDMPQVIITFDEQKENSLGFTVILLRVVSSNALTVQEIFSNSTTELTYIPDRVRRVGSLRKKYVKEATVFRTVVPIETYLRVDGSVDLYKARQFIFNQLCKLIGEVRDYNGGMLYKQTELLETLKNSLGRTAEQNDLLLQKFYYSLNPIEMRTSLDVDHLKQFFLLLLQAFKSTGSIHKKNNDFIFRQDLTRVIAVVPCDSRRKKLLHEKVSALRLPPHQLVSCFLELEAVNFMGYLLLSDDSKNQAEFLSVLDV